MRFKVRKINPAQAKQMLRKIAPNRRVRPGIVSKYANDMRNGRWLLTPQPIAFDGQWMQNRKCGRLIDGQHRLHAVIESGCTVQMLVATECDTSAIRAIDQGGIRTVGNMMQILGLDTGGNVNLQAAIARAMIAGCNGQFVTISRETVLLCIERHGESIRWVMEATGQRLRKAPAYAPIVKAVILHGQQRMQEFCESVRDNVFRGPNIPANMLTRWIATPTRVRRTHKEIYGRSVSAVRAYLEQRVIKSLHASAVDLCKPSDDPCREFWSDPDQDEEAADTLWVTAAVPARKPKKRRSK